MKIQQLSLSLLILIALGVLVGCAHTQGKSLATMSRSQQEAAFRGDPSKMPPNVKALVEATKKQPVVHPRGK